MCRAGVTTSIIRLHACFREKSLVHQKGLFGVYFNYSVPGDAFWSFTVGSPNCNHANQFQSCKSTFRQIYHLKPNYPQSEMPLPGPGHNGDRHLGNRAADKRAAAGALQQWLRFHSNRWHSHTTHVWVRMGIDFQTCISIKGFKIVALVQF